jgi:hypothetical protein
MQSCADAAARMLKSFIIQDFITRGILNAYAPLIARSLLRQPCVALLPNLKLANALTPASRQPIDAVLPRIEALPTSASLLRPYSALLTVVGGKIVYAAGDFALLDSAPPPAMPDWSLVRTFKGYGAWGDKQRQAVARIAATSCGCVNACNVHGHASAWSSSVPSADLKSFWGAFGCALLGGLTRRSTPVPVSDGNRLA